MNVKVRLRTELFVLPIYIYVLITLVPLKLLLICSPKNYMKSFAQS